MGLFMDRKLISITGTSLVIVILIATAFIMTVSVDGYCITPSPVISASPNPAFYGQNITVLGQYFTPNTRAFLYQEQGGLNGNISWSSKAGYTADVDKNGNTSWVLMEQVPYPEMIPKSTIIYGQDVSIVGRMSNTISLTLVVNPCITPIPALPLPTVVPSPSSIAIPFVSDMPTPPQPPSPAFPIDTTVIILIAIGAMLLIVERRKKK